MNPYLAIAPDLALVILLFIMLGYNSIVKNSSGRTSGIITAVGATIILGFTAYLASTNWDTYTAVQDVNGITQPNMAWGRTIANDGFGMIFRVMFLLALILTCLFSLHIKALQKGEYYALLIAATIGFSLMSVSTDLIMLLVALETASISLYLLSGFMARSERSTEAGMKYFVYGAFASALMLYGLSLLYGLTGHTNIYDIAQSLTNSRMEMMFSSLYPTPGASELNGLLIVSALLLIAGFGFKISAVPFQWWTPDVYEGAPTPVTGFLSTASKAAGFALLIRVFASGAVGEASFDNAWWALLVGICVITMVVGNMIAIFQTNIKRMLAYSSIAQAGYVLIGLLSLSNAGIGAAVFYLLMYVVTNVAAFGGIAMISSKLESGGEDMTELYGLSRRSPWLALGMMVSLLSLGGIPPTAGFFGKLFLFVAAVQSGLWWLALIGILMAFISLYYYLTVIKYMYLYGKDAGEEKGAVSVSLAGSIGMAVCIAGIFLLGIVPNRAYIWVQEAVNHFF